MNCWHIACSVSNQGETPSLGGIYASATLNTNDFVGGVGRVGVFLSADLARGARTRDRGAETSEQRGHDEAEFRRAAWEIGNQDG